MDERIRGLDDARAEGILAAITQARTRSGGYQTEWTPEVGRALREGFGVGAGAGEAVSGGELARQALLVLAEDPAYRASLAAMIEGPEARGLSLLGAATVVSGVLFALQTHVKFQLKDGKVRLDIEKKPTGDDLLKSLVTKLLGFVGASPPR